jgi:hypothetical protein
MEVTMIREGLGLGPLIRKVYCMRNRRENMG